MMGTNYMSAPVSTEAFELISRAVRALPASVSGRHQDGLRHLTLRKAVGGARAVHLVLKQQYGDDLLNVVVTVPVNMAEPAHVPHGHHFRKREPQYLEAMLAWAARVLASAEGTQLQSVASKAVWQKPLKDFIGAVTGDRGSTARAFFQAHGNALEALDPASRGHEAVDFLTGRGWAVHLDWKDDESLADLGLDLLRRQSPAAEAAVGVTLQALRDSLGEQPDIDAFAEQVQAELQPHGFVLLQLDEGSDAYRFFLVPTDRFHAVQDALGMLGLAAPLVPAASA